VEFHCAKCFHPLTPSWNECEGLMKPNDLGETVPEPAEFVNCEGCAAKNWIPHKYRRP
jgi:hypothetical protein